MTPTPAMIQSPLPLELRKRFKNGLTKKYSEFLQLGEKEKFEAYQKTKAKQSLEPLAKKSDNRLPLIMKKTVRSSMSKKDLNKIN